MRYVRETVMDAADGSTNQVSSFVDGSYLFAASAQVITTSTVIGTVTLQGSNDPLTGYPNALSQTPVNWTDLGSPVSISAAGVVMIPKTDVCYQFLRVAFTSTSGTGTITCNLKAFGF